MQDFYDNLELKNSEIYCQRARKMYSSRDSLHTSLFQFSMSEVRILGMSDSSMLGEERLVSCLQEMDNIR